MKEMAPKCGCLVDFFAISLLTMCAYTHAHPCSLFKTERKTTCRSITLHRKDANRLFKSIKCVFLCPILFYGRLNRFVQLCGFITFLWLIMWLIVVGWGIP